MSRAEPIVLFVSSNGAGMGHLTRLLALARRARGVRPVFVSLSQAVPVVARDGFAYEYIPSAGALGASSATWNPLFTRRFAASLDTFRPAAVVFDGTYPYRGITTAARARPEIPFVWCRRGMWKREVAGAQLDDAHLFRLIIEPGEVAAPADQGSTATRTDATRVGPITYLDPHEALSREDAARELGLDPGRRTALVSLGAGNINDTTHELAEVTHALLRHEGVQVVVTHPAIALREPANDDRVHRISAYPIARCFAAFDVAVAAAGYNAFHELVAAGVPTAFVPNLHTQTDDQLARARFAEAAGIGLALTPVTSVTAAAAVDTLLTPGRRDAMAAACRALAVRNGAHDAMVAVERLVPDRADVVGG